MSDTKGDSRPTSEQASEVGVVEFVSGSAEERALVRKLDMRIMPCVFAMYLMNYLDRSNIGNARIAGMATDLKLSDNRYSVALLIFFVGYLLGEVPSNMVLSRSRPSRYLPLIMCIWGAVAALFSTIQSYTGLVVARFFLGIIESGFFPGVLFFLSGWYRKAELAKRMAWFYSAAILSGGFGGLLAGGITDSLAGARGIAAWRWLFIVEGAMTITVSLICIFVLPDWPSTTRWLSPAERRLARLRLEADHIDVPGIKQLSHMASLKAAAMDWRTYIFTFIYSMIIGAGTITYFIPTITTALGFKGNIAQFMTVPVYGTAFICSILISTSADYFKERVWHGGIAALLAGVFFAAEAGITNNKVRYALLCFGAAGVWTNVPITLAYLANTISHPDEKRGISQAIVNMIANCSSIYGAFLWPSNTAPQYVEGWSTTAAFCFACAVATFLMGWLDKRYPYTFDYSGHVDIGRPELNASEGGSEKKGTKAESV